jgi:O-acetyl-ADP-ribose deacetylase (regulator of RNase III)
MSFNIVLIALDHELAQEFKIHKLKFSIEKCSIIQGDFREYKLGCLATPGNSFGMMDGGIDMTIEKFIPKIETKVQDIIKHEYSGQLPVGNCVLVETKHSQIPWIAYAPTMRVPLDVTDLDHVYNATWAVLNCVYRYNMTHLKTPIPNVVFPGFGAGVGKLTNQECARQMLLAISHFQQFQQSSEITWEKAYFIQEQVKCGGKLFKLELFDIKQDKIILVDDP